MAALRRRSRAIARFAASILLTLACASLAQAAAPPPPAQQEVIYNGEATSILGRQVFGPKGEVVGRIVDVLVDYAGEPRAAVIDFGGFMGVGMRRIAVAWRALHFLTAAGGGTIRLDMTQDQIKSTRAYAPPGQAAGPPVAVAAPPAKK